MIGGTAQGPGYTLTNAEAGRIRTAQLDILASANGTAANRAPDVVLRDLSLSATPTTAGAAVNRLVVTVGGNAPAILQVEGAVSLANAGAADGITLTAPGRLQIDHPDAGSHPGARRRRRSGRTKSSSRRTISGRRARRLINQLIADPNFAGRNEALLNNDGAGRAARLYRGGRCDPAGRQHAPSSRTAARVAGQLRDGNAYAGVP